MNIGILHYLWSADLTKSFFELILSIFTFSQYLFLAFSNIDLFSIFFSIYFGWEKSVGLPHIAYTVIHKFSKHSLKFVSAILLKFIIHLI